MNGSTSKRCGCMTPRLRPDGTPETGPDGKVRRVLVGADCPKLRRPNGSWSRSHGSWYFSLPLPPLDPDGKPQRIRQGGYPTQADAEQTMDQVKALLEIAETADDPVTARNAVTDLVTAALRTRAPLPSADELRRRVLAGQPVDARLTTGQYLTEWLAAKDDIAPNTRRSYESHLRLYLIPHLGRIRLDRLRVGHIQAMFTALDETNEEAEANNTARHALEQAARRAGRSGDHAARDAALVALAKLPPHRRPVGPASRQRIRATLRSALTDAAAQQLVTVNTAKLVRLAHPKRTKPLVWTDARVTAWQQTGEKPGPVMVWTAKQTARFLLRARPDHQYFALFQLLAVTGMRRGEACALSWDDLDFRAATVHVHRQTVQLGWATATTAPKSDAGVRTIALARATLRALGEHRRRQAAHRLAHGPAWIDTGLVFTHPDGTPIHPAQITARFQQTVREAGLPPIRVHDLRHGAATQARAAGVDAKVVQETLGHSTVTLTLDTYTSVVDELKHNAAEAVADIFTRAKKRVTAEDKLTQAATAPVTLDQHRRAKRTR